LGALAAPFFHCLFRARFSILLNIGITLAYPFIGKVNETVMLRNILANRTRKAHSAALDWGKRADMPFFGADWLSKSEQFCFESLTIRYVRAIQSARRFGTIRKAARRSA
jgi:hypothetical protein